MVVEFVKSKLKDAVAGSDSIRIIPLSDTLAIAEQVDAVLLPHLQILRDSIPKINSGPVGIVAGVECPAVSLELIRELPRI